MKNLKVISISHQSANLQLRQQLHFNEQEATEFLNILQSNEAIQGAMMLATCNRTEVYFETETVTANQLMEALLSFKGLNDRFATYFTTQETTERTIQYLMEVASGLRSMVMGDMQIINQIKRSFQESVAMGLQGKLLERGVQAMFKMHKRIHNQTQFRSGTASLSYLGLKVCQQIFGRADIREKSLLIVGAGEISQEVAKYAHKFHFSKVAIVNRTKSKAENLAKEHGFEVENWSNLEQLALEYDVIATGVSNCTNLFTWQEAYRQLTRPKIFIDLGMPANVDHRLADLLPITVLNLDELAQHTRKVEQDRLAAANEVNEIIKSELSEYMKWFNKLPANESLKAMKSYLQTILSEQLSRHFGEDIPANIQQQFIKKVSNEFVKKPAVSFRQDAPNQEFAQSLQELFS